MPATERELNKVGFSPKQAQVLRKLVSATRPTTKELTDAGFDRKQVRVLEKTQAPGGIVSARPTLTELIREAKFTKAQATLILVP